MTTLHEIVSLGQFKERYPTYINHCENMDRYYTEVLQNSSDFLDSFSINKYLPMSITEFPEDEAFDLLKYLQVKQGCSIVENQLKWCDFDSKVALKILNQISRNPYSRSLILDIILTCIEENIEANRIFLARYYPMMTNETRDYCKQNDFGKLRIAEFLSLFVLVRGAMSIGDELPLHQLGVGNKAFLAGVLLRENIQRLVDNDKNLFVIKYVE